MAMRHFRRCYLAAIAILLLQRILLTTISKGNFEIQFAVRNIVPRSPFVEHNRTSLKISDVFEMFGVSVVDGAIECEEKKQIVQDKRDVVARKHDREYRRRIPRIIHQTSKDRCLVDGFYDATQKWRNLSGYEYVFYDDNAMEKVFQMDFPEFPHLRMVTENCILSGTARADLFRYLILYVAGGVYADIDTAPHSLNAETIQADYDGFFVVEQYHLLSQYFMATSPHHPLMFYAVQQSIINILGQTDTGRQNAAFVTGPHALHAAFQVFRRDVGAIVDPAKPGFKPVWNGTFYGTGNRSVTVVGIGENENEYVWRSSLRQRHKLKGYSAMGMKHFQEYTKPDSSTRKSCFTAIMESMDEKRKSRYGD